MCLKIKYKLPKSMLINYYEKGAIVRIKKTNGILKRPVNKLFRIEYTYHETNQTDRQGNKS